jgi:glyoxylase-like metal-dependent hydrolase (beta-lactamase superfamily II)
VRLHEIGEQPQDVSIPGDRLLLTRGIEGAHGIIPVRVTLVMTVNPPQDSNINTVSGRVSPSYIIDGESIVVVDVCFPSDAKTILTFVRSTLGRDVEDIKLIVLTHSHLDHVNGVDYLMDRTHTSLAAHTNAQQYLTGKRAIPLAKWHKLREFAGFMVKHSFPRPSIVDVFSMPWSGIPGIKKAIRAKVTHWLADGESLPGHPEWKVIHTPGHTDDSICLYSARHKSLMTGDTIINDKGHLMLNPLLTLDDQALHESLKKLKQLQVDRIYPGLGAPVFGKDIITRISTDD